MLPRHPSAMLLPCLFALSSLLLGGCITFNLDPEMAVVEDSELPAVAQKLPVKLEVDFDEDGKQRTSAKSDPYKQMAKALEGTNVFKIDPAADATIRLGGKVDVADGYAVRAFFTGFTFGLFGQQEPIDHEMNLSYVGPNGETFSKTYEYDHLVGTGTQFGPVKSLAGGDVSEAKAERELYLRPVRRFTADLAEAGLLRNR